jgi:hypothetical protein
MASGRRDYTLGYINEISTGGRYPEPFTKYAYGNYAASGVHTIYTYTVPAGYRLILGRFQVSTTSGVKGKMNLFVNTTNIGALVYSEAGVFEFPDTSPYILYEGDDLIVTVVTYESVNVYVGLNLMAILEEIS